MAFRSETRASQIDCPVKSTMSSGVELYEETGYRSGLGVRIAYQIYVAIHKCNVYKLL